LDGRVTSVPVHGGEDIDRWLLKKILRDVQLSAEEFLRLIKNC
jgi:predicted RNA binding protein YcfA (HicA-like mRNA interferase family)